MSLPRRVSGRELANCRYGMTVASAPYTTRSSAGPSAEPIPIAVVLSRFPTVTETFILRELIEMERRGQSVRLVPLIKESPPVIHREAKPWTTRALYTPFLSPRVWLANLRVVMRQPVRYWSLLLRLLVGTIASPSTLVRTVALFPKAVFIADQLQREGVRHIHAHYATHPATMALIVANLAPITFSFTVHAHDIQVDRSLLRWKLREARFIRSISDFNRRFLEQLYPREATGKIEVIHVGIEPSMYASAGAPALQPVPLILCVAAHKPYKGLPVLIEACRILRDANVKFRCEVIGQGPMHDALARMIEEKGVGDVIALIGPKPQDDVARKMAAAAFFVLPSIIADDGQMEGIPVSLMEAMASGRAVISTSTSGIPELIDDNVNGLLVPPADANALARAMQSLLESPERAREMGERGRRKVRAEFELGETVSRLIARLERENIAAQP
jgi:colanic acid/amylovoran biosynthesis glycosyltransferase